MRAWRNSLILVLLIAICFLLVHVNRKESAQSVHKTIHHCTSCDWVPGVDGKNFDPSWFLAKYQIVIYSKSLGWELATFNLDWEEVKRRFPKVQLVFIYGGKSKQKLEAWIVEKQFSDPVIFDPKGDFQTKNIEGNNTGIVFNLKDGEVQGLMNPTFGEDYYSFLSEMTR